jgi:hypothetical protein
MGRVSTWNFDHFYVAVEVQSYEAEFFYLMGMGR